MNKKSTIQFLLQSEYEFKSFLKSNQKLLLLLFQRFFFWGTFFFSSIYLGLLVMLDLINF